MPVSAIDTIASALQRTVEYLLDTQDESGGWAMLPEPRILETALSLHTLATLQPVGLVSNDVGAALSRARRWLTTAAPQEQHPVATVVEQTLRDIALDQAAYIDLSHHTFTDAVYSSRQLLLYAVALSARRSVDAGPPPEDVRDQIGRRYANYARQNLKPWSTVELLAVRALIESFFGDEAAAAEAVGRIKSHQAVDGSFSQNPISTSMALLALHVSDPDGVAVRQGCQWLLDAQQPDGTWRFCTCDVWDTTLVIRALGQHPLFRERALRPALEFLSGRQNDDGGWGFGGHSQSDSDTTGAALLALPTDTQDKEQIRQAIDYLARQQDGNGLWRTWQFDHDPPAQDVVAHVLAGLDRFSEYHRVPLEPARHWLEAQYRSSVGGWRAGWYHNSPYAQLEVGRALGFTHSLVQDAGRALAASQNSDGGWGRMAGEQSCASATGLAAAALARCQGDGSPTVVAARAFLIRTQCGDGTWPGVPEMLGPRPLLTHMPIETQAFAVTGLSSVLSTNSHYQERQT
ncbi:prenyltransferase/squalene oxidase repeat-containing protein [Streptomyces noursei]|uniref:prenyltransferase/squalene oxidase repeat-containing protein n=1 Tax=Streptomyces noursei TaxID=1971 RepID=UPI001678EB76|nr:prenyltransferase/squalene oxidase repeat-containing protein [Streptomyces noursei]MCZ1014127.1 hypothetical protein [Streptomyces noursei]GGX24263.1 hypothetical protein GCM10010341_51860 [Streptomyces noursei]